MNRNVHTRFAVAFVVAATAALSCRSGDATGPVQVTALPVDSQPHLTLVLPAGRAMTSGTIEKIVIAAANVRPQSCTIAGPSSLGLKAGPDANATWTVAPSSPGNAVLQASCVDYRNTAISVSDTLSVYAKPAVIPDISGMVPVDVGDSIDVSYDSTDTPRIDAACNNCVGYARMTRVDGNTVRFFADGAPGDTTHRGLCFTAHGLDGRYTQQECVNVTIMPAQAALYSVPSAIRAAEVVSLHSVPVATYDNTGQSNHPDFMRVGAPWANGACYMVYTPYANSNGNLENPSLSTSNDCEHWAPAAGVRAPLVDKPNEGYNSDPELMYDAARGCLGVIFRQVTTKNIIAMTSSCDGKTWSAPRQLFTAPNHSAVSPTVSTGPDGVQRVWYVDATTVGCTNQNNVVKMRSATNSTDALSNIQFGAEVATDLAQPGYVVWHLKVRYVAALKLYIAMYAAFPMTTGMGDCTNDDLYMATSADGLHWQSFQAPVLDHLDRRFKFESLYRASFVYEPKTDRLRTIVSGLSTAGVWGQFGVVHQYGPLVAALNSSFTVAAAQLVPGPRLVRKAGPVVKKVITEDHP